MSASTGKSPAGRTLIVGAAGAVVGVLVATACWAATGWFLWYSWVFTPLVLGLAGVGFVAMASRSAWFERTPLYRHWTGLLGRTAGRPAIYVFLVVFATVGVTVGAAPLFGGRPGSSWELPFTGDPAEYEPLLRDIHSDNEEQRRNAIELLDWHPLPKRDIGPVRDRVRAQLLRLADDVRVPVQDRGKALAALGRYGRPADIPALEARREAFNKADEADPDNKNGLGYWCERAVVGIRDAESPGY